MAGVSDEVYKALGDAHRRRIVAALCQGPHRAGELADLVGLAPNAVSFHLNRLRAARLVQVRRQGRHLYYQLEAGGLQAWLKEVDLLFGWAGPGRPALQPKPRPAHPEDRAGRVEPPQIRTRPRGEPARILATGHLAADSFSEALPTELL